METQARRLLIREKLSDGRLPQNSISRVSGRPSEGEICHACEGVIAEAEMVIEGIFQGSVTPLQLDVDCFYLWYAERRDAGVTVRGESASDTPVPATDTAVPRTRLSLEDVRVLIVDYDETAVYSWTRYLETLGARVTSARDGREALTILRQDTIDVLVADLMLPGIDGFQLAQAVRALGRPITLIAVSAFVDGYRRALAAGFDSCFDSCLLKPVDPFDLAREIVEKRG